MYRIEGDEVDYDQEFCTLHRNCIPVFFLSLPWGPFFVVRQTIKTLVVLFLFLGMNSQVSGEVSAWVHLADSNSSPECRESLTDNGCTTAGDVMVGTKLTIVVSSDDAEYWSGSLAVECPHMDCGILSEREDSCLPAAGKECSVVPWKEPCVDGFDLYTGFNGITAGEWFRIDYEALTVGNCYVAFYEHCFGEDGFPCGNRLLYYLEFYQVPTRDFDGDSWVDFSDFAVGASYWNESNCDSSGGCGGADLDKDGCVDVNDLKLFADFWLETAECSIPPAGLPEPTGCSEN